MTVRLLALLWLTANGVAQTAPQLSPQAALDFATRPIEIVHRSIANWSESEMASLGVAIKASASACDARSAQDFEGADLIALGRLCSLGQRWDKVGAAAGRYLDAETPTKPQLAAAYALALSADMHRQELPAIMTHARAMLHALPLDTVVQGALADTLEYLQLAHTPEALELYRMREPLLLAGLRESSTLSAHGLYAGGLDQAALEQYAGEPEKAAATVATFDVALAARMPLSGDDALPIASARVRYQLLGKPLPKLALELSLWEIGEQPHINLGSATALLVFPEWCAQCTRLGPQIVNALGRLGENEVRVYGLMAVETLPDRAALRQKQLARDHRPATADPVTSGEEQVLNTPTDLVPLATLALLGAEDFPFLLVLDHAGVVRFAQPAPESVLEPGEMLDRVTGHVGELWPGAPLAPLR